MSCIGYVGYVDYVVFYLTVNVDFDVDHDVNGLSGLGDKVV